MCFHDDSVSLAWAGPRGLHLLSFPPAAVPSVLMNLSAHVLSCFGALAALCNPGPRPHPDMLSLRTLVVWRAGILSHHAPLRSMQRLTGGGEDCG